jgi:cAMP-dependent protein kinase regulator
MTAAMLKKLEEKKKKNNGKKLSRQGISAEVFGQFNKRSDFTPKVIEKDAETYEKIKKLIEKSILFQSLNKEDITVVIRAME